MDAHAGLAAVVRLEIPLPGRGHSRHPSSLRGIYRPLDGPRWIIPDPYGRETSVSNRPPIAKEIPW